MSQAKNKSNVFGEYARYYDLLYEDKDYTGETEFIRHLIQENAPNAEKILELGCGTGVHAALLAEAGYEVHGIDFSYEMLTAAQQRRLCLKPGTAEKMCFGFGDIRHIRLDEKFDVVLSLFHVISYQTTNADLSAAFETARAHLEPNGLFIFDYWSGPAVLNEPPDVRVKQAENETLQITRIAEPAIYPNENSVDVNYRISVKDKTSGAVKEFRETHRLRYLFDSELDFLIEQAGMKTVASADRMTDGENNSGDWSVYRIVSGGG